MRIFPASFRRGQPVSFSCRFEMMLGKIPKFTFPRIFAFAGSRNIGDFICDCAVSATIRENFKNAYLFLYYKNDRWYKEQIVDMISQFNHIIKTPDDSRTNFPIDFLDDKANAPVALANDRWEKLAGQRSNIVLPSAALDNFAMPGFGEKARFRIKEEQVPGLATQLVGAGLDPERWFACVYWREPGYIHRSPHPWRDITDPRPYRQLIRHIVEEQGGQVVRLGHPEMSEAPAIPGVIDLAPVERNITLQAFAVSRARYFVSSNSGPLSFGPAFGTPTLVTENIDLNGIWNEHDRSLTPVFTVNGKKYRQREAMEQGLLNGVILRQIIKSGEADIEIGKCSAADLEAGADRMLEITSGMTGWRPAGPVRHGPGKPPGAIMLPLRRSITENFFLEI